MVHSHGAGPGTARPRRRKHSLLALPLLALLGGIVLAAIVIAWLLWPRWPAPNVAVDVPSLPIIVQGVTFSIPPNAIRLKAQRKPGVQERVDLVFMWPSLTPPEQRPVPVASSQAIDRIFMTIVGSDATLPPLERFTTIYPRYLETSIGATDSGLTMRPFRADTPYEGEDILYDNDNPARFLVRCTRDGAAAMIGMCLYERRLGTADLTLRFPRAWLSDWQNVLRGIDRLIASLRASAR
jgi:hypothetical protein